MLAVLFQSNDLHRNVAGCRILLELTEDGPAQHIGQKHVEGHGGGVIVIGQHQGIRTRCSGQNLEAVVVCEIDEDTGIVGIVLDDKQDHVARLQILTVIGDLLERTLLDAVVEHRLLEGDRRAGALNERRRGRTGILEGQVKCERAAFAGRAAQLNFSAE